MATTLSLVGGKGQFTWTISGLNNWFANNQYYQAGVATKAVVGGSTSLPSGTKIVSSVMAQADPPSWSDPSSVSDTATYASGTYTFYGFVQTVDGSGNPHEYYPVGSGEVTISDSGSGIALFDWDANSYRRTAYRILNRELPTSAGFKASVWNDIVKKVSECFKVWSEGSDWETSWSRNSYGKYKSKDECLVSSEQILSRDIYNSVFWNVTSLPVPNSYKHTIDMVSPGDEITSNHFLELVEMVNRAIPNIW